MEAICSFSVGGCDTRKLQSADLASFLNSRNKEGFSFSETKKWGRPPLNFFPPFIVLFLVGAIQWCHLGVNSGEEEERKERNSPTRAGKRAYLERRKKWYARHFPFFQSEESLTTHSPHLFSLPGCSSSGETSPPPSLYLAGDPAWEERKERGQLSPNVGGLRLAPRDLGMSEWLRVGFRQRRRRWL